MDWFFDWKGWGWAGWGALGVLASVVIAVWPKGGGRAEAPAPAAASAAADRVFTIRDYQEGLEAREARLRADLGRAHGAEKELLSQERDAVAGKLADVERAYRAMLGELEAARAAMGAGPSAPPPPLPPASGSDPVPASAEAAARERVRLAMERAKAAMLPALEAAHRRGGAGEEGRIDWSDPRTRADFDAAYDLEPQNPDYLFAAATVAAVLDDDDGAESLYRRAADLADQRPEPWLHLPDALNSLANLLIWRGASDEAEPVLSRLLAVQEERLGPEDPALAHPLHMLAALKRAQGEVLEAEGLYRHALALLEKAEPDGASFAETAANLAALLQEKGEFDEAEALLRRCVAIAGADGDVETYVYAHKLHRLANLLVARGSGSEEAGFLYRRALAVTGRIFGPESPQTDEIRADFDRFTSRRPPA